MKRRKSSLYIVYNFEKLYSFDPFIPWYEWASEGKKDEETRHFGHSMYTSLAYDTDV